MASIFTSISNFTNTVLDAASNLVETTDETLTAGTSVIKNRAIALRISDVEQVKLDTAKKLQTIDTAIKDDEDLKERFDALAEFIK